MRRVAGAIEQVVRQTVDVRNNPHVHHLTLTTLQREYPQYVRNVQRDTSEAWRSTADVSIPYRADHVALLRACKGAHWVPDIKAWRVPQYSARQLSEALYVISTTSRRR